MLIIVPSPRAPISRACGLAVSSVPYRERAMVCDIALTEPWNELTLEPSAPRSTATDPLREGRSGMQARSLAKRPAPCTYT